MGEYVKVVRRECKEELDEVWVEIIDKPFTVQIASPECKCIEDFGTAQWDIGYEEGRASQDD